MAGFWSERSLFLLHTAILHGRPLPRTYMMIKDVTYFSVMYHELVCIEIFAVGSFMNRKSTAITMI